MLHNPRYVLTSHVLKLSINTLFALKALIPKNCLKIGTKNHNCVVRILNANTRLANSRGAFIFRGIL